jgi:peptidoglycan hydrolase-like protein with peptidoglycan-binding domain
MPKTHTVKQGECISSIAFKYGFFPDTLWGLPENKALKDLRGDPHVLLPGDKVHIPDKRRAEVDGAAGQRHRFKRKGVPETLALRFSDEADDPIADTPYILDIDGQVERGTTDGEGAIDKTIPPNARRATVTFEGEEGEEGLVFELQLGGIDPIEEETGLRYRLENLGYMGPDAGDPSLADALRTFQEDHGLEPTGVADDATRDAIESDYEGS